MSKINCSEKVHCIIIQWTQKNNINGISGTTNICRRSVYDSNNKMTINNNASLAITQNWKW